MKNKISVLQKSKLWKEEELSHKDIRDIVNLVINKIEKSDIGYEMSVILCSDKFIQKYNKEFMKKDKPTNVLSFPSGELEQGGAEEVVYLGDIMLAYQTIEVERSDQGKTFKAHFTHMLIHGTLHLFGYDHINESKRESMEALEIEILQIMNISNHCSWIFA